MRKQQVEVGKSVIDSALSTQSLGGFLECAVPDTFDKTVVTMRANDSVTT